MSVEESKNFAKTVMLELGANLEKPLPKKHLDRIGDAVETVFDHYVGSEQSLLDALVNEDGRDAELFVGMPGFDELQLAVNKYRNSL